MGLTRMANRMGKEKPCDSQAIFLESDKFGGSWELGSKAFAGASGGSRRDTWASNRGGKWAHDMWEGPGGTERPMWSSRAAPTPAARAAAQRAAARGVAGLRGLANKFTVPDNRLRGWSDGRGDAAPASNARSAAMSDPFNLFPDETVRKRAMGGIGVARAMNNATPMRRRRAVLAPRTELGVEDDTAYSQSGLFGRARDRLGAEGKGKGRGSSKVSKVKTKFAKKDTFPGRGSAAKVGAGGATRVRGRGPVTYA
mmetsp:Transcript_36404/g.100260  ORF Transcript_36404/g.100260 Transcript_36404/m.100260 type:complete len:255 (-) Transcript_36404:116-880(-)